MSDNERVVIADGLLVPRPAFVTAESLAKILREAGFRTPLRLEEPTFTEAAAKVFAQLACASNPTIEPLSEEELETITFEWVECCNCASRGPRAKEDFTICSPLERVLKVQAEARHAWQERLYR
jgi:hypothetical protein